MTTRRAPATAGKFFIEGRILREQPECQAGELPLSAYVFDKAGMLLGSAPLDTKGTYSVALGLAQPVDVELMVGPADIPQQIRHSSAYRKAFSAKDWKKVDGERFRLTFDTVLPLDIWRPWWPLRICISGHVRKVSHHDGATTVCPVPFVKVEIFDVDRESCLWPPLRRWWELLLDRPVIRLPELLAEPPVPVQPFPGPDPVPDLNPVTIRDLRGGTVAAQLESARLNLHAPAAAGTVGKVSSLAENIAINPQPEPPGHTRVGEVRLLNAGLAARLEKLTLTSKIAPWVIFPHCFYSKAEVAETTTDYMGYFSTCFNWWPLHFRRGRLRFDSRPDILLKVTQIIDGVSTVIYLDPYTSTRWNVTHAHIDLYLDNEEVVCGSGVSPDPLAGSPVFFTRIGDDEVYKISQTSGLFSEGSLSQVAYGGTLHITGQFGDALTTGAPARYYRLSYARHGSSDFTPITTPLSDTRVDKATYDGEAHHLGPKTVNGVPALYEVRNFSDYLWYNPDWLGTWHSWLTEADSNVYLLRLEVFDQNGVKLTSALGVDYRDGTVAPPAVLPAMTDRCDLAITLDNKAPVVNLTIPAVLNECGVIPWSTTLSLDFQVQVTQENNRLRSWGLYYTKGISPTIHYLASGTSNTGLPGSVTPTVSGGSAAPAPGSGMLTGLSSTCAFALKLWARAHVRDGRQFIYYREQLQAIAIEKCPPCPVCL
jgi:hypothetical protein